MTSRFDVSVLTFMLLVVIAFMVAQTAVAGGKIRVALLKFGTVNWELSALKHHGLDKKHGVDIEIIPYASSDATMVALMADSADIVVDDWLLVSRQRHAGRKLSFVPYSTAVGSMMVASDSPVQSLADLTGLKIGVAGGPLDKNWLLIQGLAQGEHQLNIAAKNEIVFGAPPLLAQKAKIGELDAVLNYWHYSARLEALGFRSISSAEAAAQSLGAKGAVSAIGYVFHEAWAQSNAESIAGFLAATRAAKMLLKQSDTEWQRLADAKIIRDKGVALQILRDRYREGIPTRAVSDEQQDAALLYQRLADLGGKKLVGAGRVLSEGTYWSTEK